VVNAGSTLSGISKRFSRRGPWVLDGIDLKLEPGSRTVIVGGNGSGKSTLLRIGAGVSWPNGGTTHLPEHIGYVPERLAARIKFTGAGYLAHMGRIKGLDPGVIKTRSSELVQRLDLQPGPHRPIDSLSKGNRQKLVLAQAFLGPVGLLVLDEPLSGLDATASGALADLMNEAQSEGTAVLVSSHHAFPERAGLRQLRIHDGRLAEIRPGEDSKSVDVRKMEVELLPTETASDSGLIASLPGVSLSHFEQTRGVLVLVTDDLHIDSVLTQAIAQGWSVRTVRANGGEADSE
jgi:ABC-2 type transport system ATP-binding protein